MINEQYLPAVCQQMAAEVNAKRGSRHRMVVIRAPFMLSRETSRQVVAHLMRMYGIHAQPYFVDGERSSKSILVDTAMIGLKRTH